MASWLKRGSGRRAFKNAGNYTHAPAQKRFDEAVPSFHDKIENSLQVDGVKALLFKQVKMGLGRPCTCIKFAVDDQFKVDRQDEEGEYNVTENVAPEAPILAPQSSDMDGVEIRLRKDNLFGDSGISGLTEDNIHHGDTPAKVSRSVDLAELDHRVADPSQLGEEHLADLDPELQTFYEDNVFAGSNVNCGICYKTGTQPGFECLDHDYVVLTNYDIVSAEGYHVDQSAHPACIQQVHEDGFVVFTIDVPKFFKNVKYSIRNNDNLVRYNHIIDLQTGQPSTMDDLDKHRGGQYSFKVQGANFTHVVILFDLNMQDLMVNITDESNTLSINQEDTIGNLTIVMPARIGHIISGDVIFLPCRNICLKITEAPKKQKANKTLIEWQVTTRTLQPNEPLRHIAKGYQIG